MDDTFDIDQLKGSYAYSLPDDLIAQCPTQQRDQCRLLRLTGGGNIDHHCFTDLPEILPKDCVLILNDSKVIPARVPIRRDTGALGELLLLEEHESGTLIAMGRPMKRFRDGEVWHAQRNPDVHFKIEGRYHEDRCLVSMHPENLWPDRLDQIGDLPLPPYIKRPRGNLAEDREMYQSVFANKLGSTAAPTASLHFNKELLQRLQANSVTILNVTLHVGTGTFLPMRSNHVKDHAMHLEYFEVSDAVALQIQQAKKDGRPICAVGTTVVRCLESAKEKLLRGQGDRGHSRLFIYPPYEMSIVDHMITNFHLPESTLMMLVASLIGRKNLLQAYEQAIQERYRFFSYGDAMFC